MKTITEQVNQILVATGLPQATLAEISGIEKRKFYNKLSSHNRAEFNVEDLRKIKKGLSNLLNIIQSTIDENL